MKVVRLLWCMVVVVVVSSGLPYNPLDALDWENLDVSQEIQDAFLTAGGIGFEVRQPDASNNHPEGYGSTNSVAQRCMSPDYGDGINSLAGQSRMNARELSNVLSKQQPEESSVFLNDRHLTQFAWQWGQFIDHDITLITEVRDLEDHTLGDGDISIYVPCNDPAYDLTAECDANLHIELARTQRFDSSGENGVPREQFNEITAFIDASMIYGSDAARTAQLRSGQNGELLMTDDGQMYPNVNDLPNEPNTEDRFPLGGDVRPSEQLGLFTMHTIWARFHNVIAAEVATGVDPNAVDDFDETVFQYARLIVTAIVQKITYKDWLPTMFGKTAIAQFLGDYSGYDESVNPQICLIFSSASYRLGHTLLPNFLPLRDENCAFAPLDQGTCPVCDELLGGVELRNAFFVPEVAINTDGFYEALLYGFACTLANEIDVSITGAVRNFLFESARQGADGLGDRIFGNLDLIAINLQRGREHGVPDYNSVREHYGLGAFTDFHEMTSDPELQSNFEEMYGDVNDVDLFLGGLAEDHFDDGSFGETISAVVLDQFQRFRDGDRFWYQNYIKPGELLDFIDCITLKSVIELTTNIDNVDSIDAIRHNIFQNHRAISIFDGVDTFEAKAVPQNPENIFEPQQPQNPQQPQYYQEPYQQKPNYQQPNYQQPGAEYGAYVIQLTNMQIFLLFATIITVIGCSCYTLHQCKKSRTNRYRPVKYDTETDTDREQLQR